MKKIILIVLVLICKGWPTNAQQYNKLMPENKTGMTKEIEFLNLTPGNLPGNDPDYLQISRNKQTTGWVFLGAGILCTGIGVLTFPKDYDIIWGTEKEEKSATFSTVLIIGGIASMITSVPFFISSSIYKHKAKVKLGNQTTGFGVPAKVSRNITGLTMTIPIGK